ncbi:MAG: Fe-S cluster assembly protein IscX [Candidatus Macondimonas sp.]|jgi:FeS assembly protein IscX
MKWTDVLPIAQTLVDRHPEVDPRALRFTDLHRWITGLPEFSDDPERSNERVLEAIQMAWIEEMD